MKAFDQLRDWPVDNVAAAVIGPDGSVSRYGETGRVFKLASVTKLLSAAGCHLAVEEGSVSLDLELGAPKDGEASRGATFADVLAHAGGFTPDGSVVDDPGRRRIYSNRGYDLLAETVAERCEIGFGDYLAEGIFQPLQMSSTELRGSAAFAGSSTVDDLVLFISGLPDLLARETIAAMTSPHLPELIGVLPGYGRQAPNLWGLGPEIRGVKSPHWTGSTNSPSTWGHFGQAGTFVWVDPQCDVATIVLTDRPFGEWALPLWPAFSDAVRSELLTNSGVPPIPRPT